MELQRSQNKLQQERHMGQRKTPPAQKHPNITLDYHSDTPEVTV